jgi:hypothetical protein
LVRGASKGEGLGNQFLANIREVDAIIHVLRCFEDPNVVHVEGGVDPVRDAETVETELMLADLEGLERRHQGLVKRARGNDKEAAAQLRLIEPIMAALQAGRPARTAVPPGEEEAAKRLQLLTTKPVLYVANVEEGAAPPATPTAPASSRARKRGRARGGGFRRRSRRDQPDAGGGPRDFLASLGLEDSGLDRVIRAGYALLGLVTYFTVGPKEARAWTITAGHQGARRRRRDPRRLRARLHRHRMHRLRRLRGAGRRAGRQGGRQDPRGRQGVRRQGRRRPAVPLQRVAGVAVRPAPRQPQVAERQRDQPGDCRQDEQRKRNDDPQQEQRQGQHRGQREEPPEHRLRHPASTLLGHLHGVGAQAVAVLAPEALFAEDAAGGDVAVEAVGHADGAVAPTVPVSTCCTCGLNMRLARPLRTSSSRSTQGRPSGQRRVRSGCRAKRPHVAAVEPRAPARTLRGAAPPAAAAGGPGRRRGRLAARTGRRREQRRKEGRTPPRPPWPLAAAVIALPSSAGGVVPLGAVEQRPPPRSARASFSRSAGRPAVLRAIGRGLRFGLGPRPRLAGPVQVDDPVHPRTITGARPGRKRHGRRIARGGRPFPRAPRGRDAERGLAVAREIFGANRHMRRVCGDSAALGYAVVRPALFDRAERGVELGCAPGDAAGPGVLRAPSGVTPPAARV